MKHKLGNLLIQAGVLSPQELDSSLEQARAQRESLWSFIVREKRVSEDALAEIFARELKLPRVRLASASVEPEAIRKVGEKVARKHCCLPLKIEGRSLVVAMANPLDYDALQDVQFAAGLAVRPLVASRTEILDSIEEYYATEDRLRDILANVKEDTELRILKAKDEGEEGGEDEVAHARSAAQVTPVVKMTNLIIQDAIKASASDIHVEPGLNDVQVRLRVDGVLRDYMQVPKWLHNAVVSRMKILAELDIAERRLPQDGRIRVQYRGRPLDIRISTLPTHFGEKVVMRVLGSTTLPTFGELGLSETQRVILESALGQPQGMVLVTGPTGSGKTTTLYSMITKRKSPEVNIVTVEDPIEYQLQGINQVQVNVKAGLTFANGLRAILRQDPDVILLGEIRDPETAEIAFQSSMTGHLVLSTLHTNSSLATLHRLLDLGIEPSLITSSVNLIIAQRLARRICDRCKEPYTAPGGLLERLRLERPDLVTYHGRGCPACAQTGYAGRAGIFELLRLTPKLKDLIARKAGEAELRKVAALGGTRFLLEDAMDKVRQGITTVEEVLRVVELQEEEIIHCPNCGAFIHLDFSTCPYCLHLLRNVCVSCGQELKLEWKVCPYCNARAGADVHVAAPEAPPTTAVEAPADQPEAPPPPREQPRPVSPPRAAARGEVRVPAELEPIVAPAAKTPRILVVDDDGMMRKAIMVGLSYLPFRVDVETAADGVEALEAVQKHLPDMVILDITMPRMDGLTTCERLRKDFRSAFVPILMLTANADEEHRTKGYLVGTDDFVTKPFSIPDLNARLLRLLRRTYGL